MNQSTISIIHLRFLVLFAAVAILQSGCQLSRCSAPKSVSCEYYPPMPMENIPFRAHCCQPNSTDSETAHPDPQEVTYIDLEPIDVETQQYWAPSERTANRTPMPLPRLENKTYRRNVPKTPLIEDFY